MSEVKLLPLPKVLLNVNIEAAAYARANVARATAPLQAEIEALRAEVDFRDSVIATHAADTREYQKRISQAEARAKRLAEAISAYKSECDNPAKDYVLRAKRRDEMFALLRDQEARNG